MNELATLRYALDELTGAVGALDDSQMDTVSNCAPWTVRQLASHAVNNQLLWAGIVTGNDVVSPEVAMGAVPYDGDLTPFAEDGARRALAMWNTEGVLEAMHVTPLGELPGSVVINFAIVDAVAPRVGPLRERRARDRVQPRGASRHHRGRRSDVHRCGARSWSDPARH